MTSTPTKKYTIKVYESDGSTFITTLSPAIIKNTPSFTSIINGVFGEMNIELNLPFDNFGEGSIVDYMNILKIYQVDESNQAGRLIYTGFISQYTPFVNGSVQGVNITLLGIGSLAQLIYYRTGGGSFEVPHVDEDPSEIMKAIVDYFNTKYGGNLLNYDIGETTIDTVGTNVSYTFTEKKCLEAVNDIFLTAGGGWYWKFDEKGCLWLKQKPTEPTHVFTLGKDVEVMNIRKSSEGVINDVTVKWSSGTATDSDATSQSNFGIRENLVNDTQIQNATTASQRAAQEIEDFKDAKIRANLTINLRYDIESIKVGDTCNIRNFSLGSTVLDDNMQIVKVGYNWDKVTLDLEEVQGEFGIEMQKFINK